MKHASEQKTFLEIQSEKPFIFDKEILTLNKFRKKPQIKKSCEVKQMQPFPETFMEFLFYLGAYFQ